MRHINALAKVDVRVGECGLPTFCWLAELHGRPYRSRFVSNSGHCSAAVLSGRIASALAAVGGRVVECSETAFSNGSVGCFWSIGGSSDAIGGLRLRSFWGFSGVFFRLFCFVHLIAA